MNKQKWFRAAMMILCAGVFVAGATRHLSQRVSAVESEQERPARAFTATILEYRIDPQGKKTPMTLRIKEVNSDGSMTEEVFWVGRDKQRKYHRDASGFVATDGKTERVIQDLEGKQVPEQILSHRKRSRTAAYYENHPGLVGTEMVAGLKAYTIRSKLGDKAWEDASYSPETGNSFIKAVHHNSDGSMVLIETVKIEFK